jgi:hypothetical protein
MLVRWTGLDSETRSDLDRPRSGGREGRPRERCSDRLSYEGVLKHYWSRNLSAT